MNRTSRTSRPSRISRGNSVFTIVAEIREGEVEPLTKLLVTIGDDIKDNDHLRLADVEGLHYASFVVVDCPTPHLLFEGNIDGTVPEFLERLARTKGDALTEIWSHCVDFPSGAPRHRVVDYLARHDIGANAFYIAWPGRTVKEIRAEQDLREELEKVLDAELAKVGPGDPPPSPEQLRARLQEFVRNEPSLAWARETPTTPFLVRNGRRVLIALLAPPAVALLATLKIAAAGRSPVARRLARSSLLALVALVAAAVVTLRRQELGDDRLDAGRDPTWDAVYADWSNSLLDIVQRENVQGQNHLASVTLVKPGPFRLALLRVVLFAVNLVATLTANRGSLGGIASIHFARWAITPNRKSVVFLSNFDGSWERYLNDFIDLAAIGLTAVWTNTSNEVGFPSTRWLLRGGARDEQRFKSYARYSQARTLAWYSAYPDLSNENIANNRAIREQLFAPLGPVGTEAWLRRF